MCETERFIRDCSARRMSKTATAAALGVSYRQFKVMLEVLPAIDWPAPHEGLDRQLSDEARRGRFTEAQRRVLMAARIVLKEQRSYTVRGVKGTIPELVAHFKAGVPASTVRQRMSAGLTLEAALFTPPTPAHLRKRRPLSAWEAVDEAFADQPAPQCM